MSVLNVCLWAAGLALQLLLVAALFARGVAKRFPVFTTLILFYVARSVFLFTLFGHVAQSTYSGLYDLLSWIDLSLQILLAVEIGASILRHSGGQGSSSRRTTAIGTILVFTALMIAGVVAALLPSPGRIPVDRGAAFAAVLMLFLMTWAVAIRLPGPSRRIVEGFAVYGASAVAIGLERSYAALYRNAAAYTAGSYSQACVYIIVVAYWLFTLKLQARTQAGAGRIAVGTAFPSPLAHLSLGTNADVRVGAPGAGKEQS